MNKKISTERSQQTLWQNLSDHEAQALQGGTIQPVGDLKSVFPSVKVLVLLFANPFSA